MLRRNFKWLLQLLLGICVSGVMLYWLAEQTRHSVDGFQVSDVVAVLRSVPVGILMFVLLCQLVQGWIRALRYEILLRWDDDCVKDHLQMRKLLALTFARNMFVDLLPSRMGELMYVWMAKRLFGAKFSNGLASLGSAFVFDLLGLLVLFSIVLLVAFIWISGPLPLGLWMFLIAVAVIAIVGFFYGLPVVVRWVTSERKCFAGNSLFYKFSLFLADFRSCIVELKKRNQLARALVYSLLIRLIKYCAVVGLLYVILARSFGQVELQQWMHLFFSLVAGEGAASLPMPTFMSFGTYEIGASATLQQFGFSAKAAIISTFAVHLITQAIDYSLGVVAMLLAWLLGWLTANSQSNDCRTQRSVKLRLLLAAAFGFPVVCIALGIGWIQYRDIQIPQPVNVESWVGNDDMHVSVAPDNVDPSVIEETLQTVATVVDQPLRENQNPTIPESGFAVWASNRFGNPELVHFDFESHALTRLTDSPEKEFYPSISPDGKRILYMFAPHPGPDAGALMGWSIGIYDLETGTREVVIQEGFHPNWVNSHNAIVFTRNRNEVWYLDLDTGEERMLIQAGKDGIPWALQFWTPDYNEAMNALAVTIRGSRRTKLVYFPGEKREPVEIPFGCQLSWAPNSNQLVFTDADVGRKSAIVLTDIDRGSHERLFEIPTDQSYIYFPRLSGDAKWLIFAMSPDEHNHEWADYDVYLWRIGSDTGYAIRLAQDPGNDNWPDVYIPFQH